VNFCLVLSTVPSPKTARKLALALVQNRLAACVNVVNGLDSFFWWQGKVDQARESLLVIKTTSSHFPRLVKFLKKQHPYEVPEIIGLPIEKGNREYLRWIEETLKRSKKSR